jgi:hypothetical protein
VRSDGFLKITGKVTTQMAEFSFTLLLGGHLGDRPDANVLALSEVPLTSVASSS